MRSLATKASLARAGRKGGDDASAWGGGRQYRGVGEGVIQPGAVTRGFEFKELTARTGHSPLPRDIYQKVRAIS